MIKVLIVDDEPLARENLRVFLQEQSDIEIVGECSNAVEGIGAVHKLRPDVLFLDIQMPRISGLEMVGMLDPEHRPYIVFLTAFDEYAIKAFEEHGIKVGKHPSNSDLSVMVFESFDALTRFSWNVLREVDTLIIDEFHMIGEYSRGPTLESAITRAKIINPSLRIIALSATLKNIDEIEQWLDGKTVEHDYRPVPLNKEVLDAEMFNTKNKNDVIVKIVEKAIEDNSQALSFVSTRRFTEKI